MTLDQIVSLKRARSSRPQQNRIQETKIDHRTRTRHYQIRPLGFTRFHVRGIRNVKAEWQLMALGYNCKRFASVMQV